MNTVVVKPADNGRMEQQLERLLHQIIHAVSCHFWTRNISTIKILYHLILFFTNATLMTFILYGQEMMMIWIVLLII